MKYGRPRKVEQPGQKLTHGGHNDTMQNVHMYLLLLGAGWNERT